ncbi:hypothetical protein CCACVL1_29082, partial [Corchorus capsularis]
LFNFQLIGGTTRLDALSFSLNFDRFNLGKNSINHKSRTKSRNGPWATTLL